MSTFSKVLGIVGLLLVLALYVSHTRAVSMQKTMTEQQSTITTLQAANDQQATEINKLQLQEKGLRKLLGTQNAALAELDQQNRKTADELQQALDTPPAGRPDCAREPLPAGAQRLLQPTAAGGDHPGGKTPPPGGAGTALPGA